MKIPDQHELPTAVADTRSLMRELEELGRRLKLAENEQRITATSELVIKGK